DFAAGLALAPFRLAWRGATLAASGRVLPALDLRLALRHLPLSAARRFAPGLALAGTADASATLTGTPAAPRGRLRLAVSGLRALSGPARALPPARITGQATLSAAAARIRLALAAGPSVALALAGTLPLAPGGALALDLRGPIDLALLDPLLAGAGRRVGGRLTLAIAAAGTLAAPRLSGTLRLAGGSFTDAVDGIHLTDLSGTLRGSGRHLALDHVSAAAGPGRITLAGTIAPLSPGVPLDLRLGASNAEPLASDLLTARLDALEGEPAQALAADVERMNRLVDQMLKLARLDAVALDTSARVDLHAVALEVVEQLAPLAIAGGREIVLSEVQSHSPVRGNRWALAMALANLVENALAHSPPGAEVEIAVAPGSLEVRDRGPGVPEAERASIFRRFATTRAPSAGAGLGLAIVAGIAAAHDGSVEVTDRAGGGAAFTFRVGKSRILG
ncbi:MAG: ATP-binding protein, partial [Acetobacteraceae bacterium]